PDLAYTTLFRSATTYGVPRIVYINKMDKLGANFLNATETLHERLDANAHPVQLPIGAEDDFDGIIDLIDMKAYHYHDDLGENVEEIEIPDDMKELADTWRTNLIEAIADLDEDIMMSYIEGEEIDVATIKEAIRKAKVAFELYTVYV